MGDPRKLRRKFKRPMMPFEKARIDAELKYLGEYGLRNKTEFWKARGKLSKFRRIARDLKTMPENQQKIAFKELMTRLRSLGLVGPDATTDDVLSLSVENILERRLQTLVFKKGLARSIYQARQLVAHKHILVRNKVIASPSYLVKVDEEAQLGFNTSSPFNGEKQKIFGEKPKPTKEEPKERAPRQCPTRKKTTRPTNKSTAETGKKSSSSKE